MVTASAGVQTDLSRVVHSLCRSICHSSEPQRFTVCISSPTTTCFGHRCSEHKLVGSHYLCLPFHGSRSQVIQKIRQSNYLIFLLLPGWPGMPWFWDLVQPSTEIPLQLPVSTTPLKQSHNQVFHSDPQHLNLHAWCLGVDSFSVEVAERIVTPQRSSTRTIYKSSGPYLRNDAERIRWISPLPM